MPQPTAAQAGRIIYVNINATPGGDGASWGTAYQFLQDGLAAAPSNSTIWVAKGIYYPDDGGNVTDNDRTASFNLKAGVFLYGGFAGGETDLLQRTDEHPTILSGDIDQNGLQSGNSYHVLRVSSNTVHFINTVTVRDGNADGQSFPHNSGGGILVEKSNALLQDVIVKSNAATEGGGGIAATNGSTLNVFLGSSVEGNSAGDGGGIYCKGCTAVLLRRSSITNNTARYSGGEFTSVTARTLCWIG